MPLQLILATGNAHKVSEIAAMLGPNVSCLSMRELGPVPELVETGDTFEANASMKASQLAEWLRADPSRLPETGSEDQVMVLADDSGLEVDALDGDPGVRSARYAATPDQPGNASDSANNEKLLQALKDVPNDRRTGRFRCVLALLPLSADHQLGTIQLFAGACEGRLAKERSGSGGFGYDPLFYPTGYEQSFGELGSDVKNGISHRARALEALVAHLQDANTSDD